MSFWQMFSEMSSCQFSSINNLAKQSLVLFSCGAQNHWFGPLCKLFSVYQSWFLKSMEFLGEVVPRKYLFVSRCN